MDAITSTPSFFDFDPTIIPFQAEVIHDIDFGFDWSAGVHELLLSGSVGSAKSLLGAHLAVKHCLKYSNARFLIARRALPDIKDTIYKKIIEHLSGRGLVEGVDYFPKDNTADIYFKNGSQIISKSWADKKYYKLRSLEFSAGLIEEAVENKGDDWAAIKEVRQRIGRLPHIKENFLLFLTNPDSPSHPLYKEFFTESNPRRKIYFSLTEQNPFLPKTYIQNLKETMTEKEARRMLKGEWLEVDKDRIYYAYDSNFNYKKEIYSIRGDLPVGLSFDFNIRANKPMSCSIDQYHPATDEFHFFDECVVYGARTETLLEEIQSRGMFDLPVKFEIYGDATGRSGSSKSKYSDYEIIEDFLKKVRTKTGQPLSYELLVPRSNPPVRERHNIMNRYFHNANDRRRLFVYEKAKTLHTGFQLVSLAKGADYIENQDIEGQDITTAAGYRVVYKEKNKMTMRAGNL